MWSAQIFQAHLAHREETESFNIDAMNPKRRNQFVILDARRIITIDEDEHAIRNGGAELVFWDASRQKMQAMHAEDSFTEVMELAYFGAKVIHPKTMQPAILLKPQIYPFIYVIHLTVRFGDQGF